MEKTIQSIPIWLKIVLVVVVLASAALVVTRLLRSRQVSSALAQPIPANNIIQETPVAEQTPGEISTFAVQISEGKAQPQTAAPPPQATGQALSASQVQAILDRLPDLTPVPGQQSSFNLAQQPIPPPRPGEVVKELFPPAPAGQAAPVSSGPLTVLRYQPEGEINIAPFLNITFDQPMVALDTLEVLAVQDVPARIDPPLQGTWRWLGTRTLNFTYDSDLIDRLPKATRYTVTIPAGTKSATGGVLAQEVRWSFTTPAVKVTISYPDNRMQPRDPLFFIHFDQRIDPDAVLQTVRVTAGGQPVTVKRVEETAIQDSKEKHLLKNAKPGRWLAFRAVELLPADSEIVVTTGPDTPSAEGPLLTTESQSYSFRTYAPLRIEEHGCQWGGAQCQPLSPFYIRFNNPINTQVYRDDMLRIEPEIPGVSVNIYGTTLEIRGATRGQTTYTVYVSQDIQDEFGQTLGKDARLTFRVDKAQSFLSGPDKKMVILDPFVKKPSLSVFALNYPKLDLQVYAVQPTDWPAYMNYLQTYQNTDQPPALPGRRVDSRTINVESATDTLTEVRVELSQYLDGAYGQLIVVVAPPQNTRINGYYPYYQVVHAWAQITQIGLDAYTDHSEMLVWASSLKDGSPLDGVTITAQTTGQTTVTGRDGMIRFPIPNNATYLVAAKGADRAVLPQSDYYYGSDGWHTRTVYDELRWYVMDDRQMYRPGEEVHLKGWIRRIGRKQDGEINTPSGTITSVNYTVTDAQGNQVTIGTASLNALGGFDFAFQLPKEINLGYTQIQLHANGSASNLEVIDQYHAVQVQEFRRPEFEVTARNETPGPYFAGESAVVAVSAQYYAGGSLPNADVTWSVTHTNGTYSPPNWEEFTFGKWTPWWFYNRFDGGFPGGVETQVNYTGKTDAAGEHFLKLDFGLDSDPHPVSVTAAASIMDVNRQAWDSSTRLLVHPASLYVGLRSDRYFVQKGTPLKIDFIVTDLDGKPVVDRPVTITAARLEWKFRGGQWREIEASTQTCQQGSQSEPGQCVFETPAGGTYRIRAEITDPQGRRNLTEITRWVSGGQLPPSRSVEQEELTLIPNRETYQPGDVAEILVQAPFSKGEGLLTTNRNGIVSAQAFRLENGSATLKITLTEQDIPNLNVQVDVNGAAPRTDDQGNTLADGSLRPAFATGTLMLKVPPERRKLTVEVKASPDELEPGGSTTLDVTLRDAGGAPLANAEAVVIVVDEAILALTGYQVQDPLSVFYTDRPTDWYGIYGRSYVLLASPFDLSRQDLAASQEAAGGGADTFALPMAAMPAPMATMTVSREAQNKSVADEAAAPIRVRTDFNPLAAFVPSVKTDAAGKARLEVKLPDNLTRYRVIVVAVDEARKFGTGESNLTARLPLMVRPSAPRFLNFGDRFELPVVLQNQTGEDLTVDVALRALNLEMSGTGGTRVVVPARDRVEVRFPGTTRQAGKATVQIAVVSGSFADAATIELPVYTPATTEAFATYGVIDQGAVAQPVGAPKAVYTEFGGLEISTSSTAVQALTDAVLYLVAYPYECSEQLASRVLGIAALRDVLTAFKAEGLPEPKELEAAVQRDIDRLKTLQNADGGFPYWRRGDESVPFNTVHVAHALHRAEMKGFTVPQEMKTAALTYLRQIETTYPDWYSEETRRTISAYALYVRNLMGDKDGDKALKLLGETPLETWSLDGLGWLWPVLQDTPAAQQQVTAIRTLVNNRAVETAGAANFTTDYDEQNYLLLGSNRRTDAILLDALIGDNPQSDLIPKLVNGLLAHRTKGRWMNTQENVFVLLALDKYFNTYEAQTPDFVAQIWLGETFAGSHAFKGRTTERAETNIPMQYLVDPALGGGQTQNLIINKDGAGRLYYRLGLRYAPTSLRLDPLDMGFVVRRAYEGVDNPSDVTREENGTWRIKAGARVRVRISMVADNRRYHVALADPLPAGLEIMNPALAVTGELPGDPNNAGRRNWWWWGPWYDHQNLRDERAEAFATLLWDGVYEYTYYARATTPGEFVAPPAKAEEMYSPEVFGRSSSDIVVVE